MLTICPKYPTRVEILMCLPNSINKRDPRFHDVQAAIVLSLNTSPTLTLRLKIISRALSPDIAILGFFVNLPLKALLSAVHPPEDKSAVYLGCGESQMQKRRDNLEGKTPPVPCASKQPHRHNGLGGCSHCGCKAGDEEDPAEEVVPVGEDTVENDSDVGEQLEHDIECT